MKLTTLLGLVLALAACGGSGKGATGTTGGGGGTTGGCSTALCNSVCCATGDSCIDNACCAASLSCGKDDAGLETVCCAAQDSCIDNSCCPPSQACGSTCCPGPDSDGGGAECVGSACCPTDRACGEICCDPGSECITDEQGTAACFVICGKSADCDSSTPCCELVSNGNGLFSGNGICTATPLGSSYQCLCAATSECGILGADECVPNVNASGNITGPYVCAANDGNNHDGCQGEAVSCSGSDLYCAVDPVGNRFCSNPCNLNDLCGNPGVACCNTACLETEYSGNMCCGLCAQDGGG